MSGRERIAFIGDVHLDQDDEALADFLAFLEGLASRCGRLVLMGDLFNLWIAREETEGAHQRAVIDKLTQLRRDGLVVRYLEGNRDYGVGRRHTGGAFDDATENGIVETFGGRSIYAIHGDLANTEDRQYRTWRRFSRSAAVWAAYGLVPAALRGRLAARIERRFRATNREFKRQFPEEMIRRYAAGFVAAGHDTVVLGHFHVERAWTIDDSGSRVFVLPEWRESRRHLEVDAIGEVAFVDSH